MLTTPEKQLAKPSIIDAKIAFFFDQVSQFDEFGTTTRQFNRAIEGLTVPYYINEFWTSKQRAAHSLHEVSYRACFKPQLPRFFIERLTAPEEVVLDPFMGRGTTVLEAAFLDRTPKGNDINPLSAILCSPRLSPPSLEDIAVRLEQLKVELSHPNSNDLSEVELENLKPFYHPDTLNHLSTLRRYMLDKATAGKLDHIDAWIRMVATNRLTGHSTGFFSVYTLPPNQAVTADRQIKINQKRQQVPPQRDIFAIILKKSTSLLSKLTSEEEQTLSKTPSQLSTGFAHALDSIANSTVSLVVTSPPFLDVVDYRSDNWLRCWFNGIDSSLLPISQLKKPEQWVAQMTDVFEELKNKLTPTGIIAFEVGEVKGGKLLLEDLVIKAANLAGLITHGVLVNDQQFTKTANCWGVDNQSKGTNTNRIVILSK